MITVIHWSRTDKIGKTFVEKTELFTGKKGRQTALAEYGYYKINAKTIDGCDLHMQIYEPIKYRNGQLFNPCETGEGIFYESFSTDKKQEQN